MEEAKIKQIIEALLFSTDKPLPLNQIDEVLDGVGAKVIEGKIKELNSEYTTSKRSYRIEEIAGGFVMVTLEEFAPWLKKLYKTQASERLSGPALESLAIVAYKQPITKPEIEFIRGVNVDGVLKTLMDRSLVRIMGRKEGPGRPFIYATTTNFLKHFGLASLKELPPIEEFGIGDVQLGESNLIANQEPQGSVEKDEKEA